MCIFTYVGDKFIETSTMLYTIHSWTFRKTIEYFDFFEKNLASLTVFRSTASVPAILYLPDVLF